ncbi:MAG: tRNA (adenosine(37)-N6)-dimethylallyltransferase MiaA [Bacteroidales bacterium]|nr:tRNA (adenosine(37)-N6)-dimethylallyltransferase MiaA [Bacteroidales bacterium]
MQHNLIVITGATGTGKTGIAADVVRAMPTEIISCDSRQFYREMKTGTAMPSTQLLREIPHHFVGHLSVTDNYSSNLFEKDVLNLLPSLFKKYGFAVMTGGSGLYIDAVTKGIDNIPDTDPEIRKHFQKRYEREGIESLRNELKKADPVHFARVDLQNYKRIIRALEVTASAGRPYSSFLGQKRAGRDFRVIMTGIRRTRDDLYERINRRVDEMVAANLEEEARSLLPYREFNALKTVGYREFFSFFDGDITREKAIELIKRNSRHYARRQETWFKKYDDMKWFTPEEKESLISYISENIR